MKIRYKRKVKALNLMMWIKLFMLIIIIKMDGVVSLVVVKQERLFLKNRVLELNCRTAILLSISIAI